MPRAAVASAAHDTRQGADRVSAPTRLGREGRSGLGTTRYLEGRASCPIELYAAPVVRRGFFCGPINPSKRPDPPCGILRRALATT
jgi:hypothetical protein